MITGEHLIAAFFGAVIGIGATLLALYRYVQAHISPKEAKVIYDKARAAIDEYNRAKADGTITPEEKLKIAEKTLSALEEIIKSLED